MFEPANTAHAIVEMVVFLEFEPNQPSPIKKTLNFEELFKDLFPRVETIDGVRIDIQPDGSHMTVPDSAKELKRFRADGNIEWVMRISPTSVSVHCVDYSRWSVVWDKVSEAFRIYFEEFESDVFEFREIGLKYLDRFTYRGEVEDYDVSLLFNKDSGYLNSKSFEASRRWHCHTGWYDENGFEALDVLNQMKVDAGLRSQNEMKEPYITIDHTTALRAKTENKLSMFTPNTVEGRANFERLINHFHDNNKEVMGKLLVADIASLIQLKQ